MCHVDLPAPDTWPETSSHGATMYGPDPIAAWSGDVVLKDGSTVHVRPIRPDDVTRLQEFHARQPMESQYFRYFSAKASLSDQEATRFANVDLRDRGALVVEDGSEFIAWASYERLTNRDDADVAFHVDEAHLKRGIATLLLEHLSAMAESAGIRRFTAQVLADNRAMSRVFTQAGWTVERHFDGGILDFAWPLDATARVLSSIAKREQRADSTSMARFLHPRSVAVIGASETPDSVGRVLFEAAMASDPAIRVHPVNPGRREVLGVPCVASIDDITTPVDLAIIAVPPDALAEVMAACARRRVRGAVVITEVDDDFPTAEVVGDARRHGMRVVGPGSMGLATPTSQPPLFAHLARARFAGGSLAISLQSGSLGASVLDRATRLGIGIASFVSLGDKADVSANDLLQFWDDDPTVGVVAIYTESFGNPRRFVRIARRVGRSRPIIAAKAGSDPLDDALYHQAGVIRVDSVAHMLDTARVLAQQPLPRGNRVAVVSNSPSPARLLIAALDAVDLKCVGLPAAAESWHRLPWSIDPQGFADAVAGRLADGSCDAVVAIYAPPTAPLTAAHANAIGDLVTETGGVPLVTVFLGQPNGPIRPGSPIPNFAFPDDVAQVLDRAVRYARWRDGELEHVEATTDDDAINDPDRDVRIRGIIDRASVEAPGGGDLPLTETASFLDALGIPFAAARLVTSVDEAVSSAGTLGFPVALKAADRQINTRGRAGGVALDLADAGDVRAAWSDIEHALGSDHEAHVQVMVPAGIECRVRATIHPSLGPIVAFGLGGVFADSLGDRVVRLAPVDVDEAASILAESQAGRVIASLGGSTDAIAEIISTVSAALDRHEFLADIDLNPLLISADGCWVTDATIRIRPPLAPIAPMRRLI